MDSNLEGEKTSKKTLAEQLFEGAAASPQEPAQETDIQAKPGETTLGEMAIDVGLEAGGSIAGQAVGAGLSAPTFGLAAPVLVPVGGAIGGGLGNTAAQVRQILDGERDSFSFGELGAAVVTGAIPGGKAYKATKVGTEIAKHVAKRGLQGSAQAVASEVIKTGIDEGRLPTVQETLPKAVAGFAFGGAVGGIEATVVNKLSNKSAAELADQVKQNNARVAAAERAGEDIGQGRLTDERFKQMFTPPEQETAPILERLDDTKEKIRTKVIAEFNSVQQVNKKLPGAAERGDLGAEFETRLYGSQAKAEADVLGMNERVFIQNGLKGKEDVDKLSKVLVTRRAIQRLRANKDMTEAALAADEAAGLSKARTGDIVSSEELGEGRVLRMSNDEVDKQWMDAGAVGRPPDLADSFNLPAPVSGNLPEALRGAKPTYSYRDRRFVPVFESDVDKAIYIVGGKGKSMADDSYRQWLRSVGYTDEEMNAYGEVIRDAIKRQAAGSQTSGQLFVGYRTPGPAAVSKAAPKTTPEPTWAMVEFLNKETGEKAVKRVELDKLNVKQRSFRNAEEDVLTKTRIETEMKKRGYKREDYDTIKENPNYKKVGDITMDDAERAMERFQSEWGDEVFDRVISASDEFQNVMRESLQLQVASGRLSQESFDAIVAANDFYAPFKVFQEINDAEIRAMSGSGRNLISHDEIVKKIVGITREDFRLEDPVVAAQELLFKGRILAEKNFALSKLGQLADADTTGQFFRRVGADDVPGAGRAKIEYVEGGVRRYLEVTQDVADSVKGLSGGSQNFMVDILRKGATPFRYGTTAANAAFQVVNATMADIPRLFTVSKLGPQSFREMVEFLPNVVDGYFTSFKANVFGANEGLYANFIQSGAGNSTFQDFLRDLGGQGGMGRLKSIRGKSWEKEGVVNKLMSFVDDLSKTVEEGAKVTGFKIARKRLERGDFDGDVEKFMQEMVTEVRRYAGSPDFSRKGLDPAVRNASVMFMFFNARLQGVAADVSRLGGADGGKAARMAWARIGGTVGLGTGAVYLMNNSSEELRQDYLKEPDQVRKDNWLIPLPTHYKDEFGNSRRLYVKVPKRETMGSVANLIEGALEFGFQKNPSALITGVGRTLEGMLPINVSGRTMEERAQSVVSSLNPIFKTPVEIALNKDTFRKRSVENEDWRGPNGRKPEDRYRKTTSEFYKQLAVAMPDWAPESLRSPVMLEHITRSLTGNLFTQFVPGKPAEGLPAVTTAPVVKRFVSPSWTDYTDELQRLKEIGQEVGSERFQTDQRAIELITQIKEAKDLNKKKDLFKEFMTDKDLVESAVKYVKGEMRGLTPPEVIISKMSVEARAIALHERLLAIKDPKERGAYLVDLRKKKILTTDTIKAMAVYDQKLKSSKAKD